MLDNYGLILDNSTDERDLFFGVNERVKHEYTVSDWLPFYSKGELQIGTYFDTHGCVSFATLNAVEAKFNYLIKNDRISLENIQWLEEKGYVKDMEINFSDRFIVSLSGTTSRGNTARNVWNAIRKYGLVPEHICAWDRGRNVPQEEKFQEWYRDPKNVSHEALELGKEFLERFDILYERVYKADYLKAVKHSPLLVFIATSCPREGGVQMSCGKTVNHAVTLPNAGDDYLYLFDHYHKNKTGEGQEKFLRKVSKDYLVYSFGYSCDIKEKKPKVDTYTMKLVKTADMPEIWALTKSGKRMHIINEANFYAGHNIAGIWSDKFDIVSKEELEKYPICDIGIAFTINKIV